MKYNSVVILKNIELNLKNIQTKLLTLKEEEESINLLNLNYLISDALLCIKDIKNILGDKLKYLTKEKVSDYSNYDSYCILYNNSIYMEHLYVLDFYDDLIKQHNVPLVFENFNDAILFILNEEIEVKNNNLKIVKYEEKYKCKEVILCKYVF